MARHATIPIPADQWTQLTNDDASVVLVQVASLVNGVTIQATTGAAPGVIDGYSFRPGASDTIELAQDFPGVSGATRLWAHSAGRPSAVFVSHAGAGTGFDTGFDGGFQ